MKAIIQRVSQASVRVEGEIIASIEHGGLILLGVAATDTLENAIELAKKTASLRFFDDEMGVPNLSFLETKMQALVVSQFTIYADTRKGNRPSYILAAKPEQANELYEHYVWELKKLLGDDKVQTGKFRAMMQVMLINEGPFTLEIEK